MTFFEYFKDVCRWRYIQNKFHLSAVIEGASKSMDTAKDAIYWLRDQAIAMRCDDQFLNEHAKSRNIETLTGETDEDFKNRIIFAYSWFRRAGRKAGMKENLNLLGWPDAEIINCRDYDLDKWAEFDIELYANQKQFSEENFKSVLLLINNQKPARSKLNALGINSSMERQDYFGGIMFCENDNDLNCENIN
jgi:P2-related tail formation protein